MSGGKGGGSSSSTEIPAWIKEPAQRNIQRAEDIQKIGYMPYYGPDVAALTPMQQMGMQQNVGAAQAFGLAPQGNIDVMAGMPKAETYQGGVQGYSAAPLYEQALSEVSQRQPTFMERYNKLYE